MKKGFTLIEVLVSIAIIAGIGVVVSQVFFTTTKSNTKAEILKDTKQNGEFALEVIGRMIRSSRELAASCSGSGTTNERITITNPDGGATTIACAAGAGVTRIASTSATKTEYLTASTVSLGGGDCTADSLYFLCRSVAGVPREIQIGFQLSQKGTPPDQFAKSATPFQTTVVVRNASLD